MHPGNIVRLTALLFMCVLGPIPASARELLLNVVHADTGQSLPGFKSYAWFDSNNGAEFTFDENAQHRLPVPDAARTLGIAVKEDRFVSTRFLFGYDFSTTPIPETYTLRVSTGVPIGGVVRDEDNAPVQNVRLIFSLGYPSPNPDEKGLNASAVAHTDADGRWTYPAAPRDLTVADLYPEHPDVLPDRSGGVLRPIHIEQLFKQTHVTIVRRGTSLTGVVFDHEGKPLAGAEVATTQFGSVSAGKSDERGKFTVRGLAPQQRQIIAKADGFAPQAIPIDPAEKKPVEIRLQKGKTLNGLVVDDKGNPVPNAAVLFQNWKGINHVADTTTDAQGRFTWNSAPPESLTVVAYKLGFARMSGIPFTAGDRECRLTLNPLPPAPLAPAPAPAVAVQGAAVNAPPRPAESLAGVVLQPDGRPAVGAHAALRTWREVRVDEGRINFARNYSLEIKLTRTGHAGEYTLPAQEGRVTVFAVHESGWAEHVRQGKGPDEPLRLREWCVVEGTLMNGDKPDAGKIVRLHPKISKLPENRAEYPARTNFHYEDVTDASGHFSFDRVIDGSVELTVQYGETGAAGTATGHRQFLELRPGEHRVLRVGGAGRPVVGKVLVHDDFRAARQLPQTGELSIGCAPPFVPPHDFADLTDEQKERLRDEHRRSDAYREFISRPNTYAVLVKPDGAFRADDVPPGEYKLWIPVLASDPAQPNHRRAIASATKMVTVAEVVGGRSSEPLDVGEVPLLPHHFLEINTPAPAFTMQTFDGKQTKLADYRGKFVLLTFWATWCGPCIAEMKQLEALHKEIAGEERFIILSVAVDDRIDAPAKFLQTRNLPWPQAYAGDSSPQSAHRTFGVEGIPSNWLISPDGTILAKQFYNDDIRKLVKDALK